MRSQRFNMVKVGPRRSQLFIKVKYAHTWSNEVAGGRRVLIRSHLVIGGHSWPQRSNIVTPSRRTSHAVTKVLYCQIFVTGGLSWSQRSCIVTLFHRRSEPVTEV